MGNEIQLQNLNLQSMQGFSMQGMLSQQFSGINVGGVSIGEYLAGIQDVENISSSNTEQKVGGIQSLINRAMSIISKFSVDKEAQQEVAANSKNTAKTNSEIEKQKSELSSNIEEISSQIGQETEVINAAKEEIETANKKLQEEQDRIKQINNDINTRKDELSKETDPEKQKAILLEIQSLSGQLATSASVIADAQDVIKCASQEVADSVAIIEELNAGAFQIQQEGEKNVAKLSQETAKNAQDNATIKGKAVKNEAVGNALEQSAQAASSNVFSGSAAPQLYKAAFEHKRAASTGQTGAALNLTSLQQGIGGINNNVDLLNKFSTAIGGAFTDYANSIGDWNKVLEPAISSFGSMMDNAANYTTTAGQLNTAVTSDLSKLDEKTDEKETGKQNSSDTKEQNSKPSYMQYQQPPQFKPAFGLGNETEQQNKFETTKVDVELEA